MKILRLSLIIVFSIVLLSQNTKAQYSESDSLALTFLRDATGGGNGTAGIGWNRLSNFPPLAIALGKKAWLSNNSVQDWYGISWEWDGAKFRVTKLDLNGANFQNDSLQGVLPNYFFDHTDTLFYMDTLILSNNLITGVSPQFVNTIDNNLRYFNISNNLIIPYDDVLYDLFYKMDNLESFIAVNMFDKALGNVGFDSINIESSFSLRHVELSDNSFEGMLSTDSIINGSKWENLQTLYLDKNLFSSLETPQIANSSFTKLSINNNDFNSIVEIKNFLGAAISLYPSFKFFMADNAMDNSLTYDVTVFGDQFLPTISNTMDWIDLGNNNLDGKLGLKPDQLKVQNLLLDNNDLDSIYVTGVGTNNTTFLQLNISENDLKGTFPLYFFDKCINIQTIYAQNNKLKNLPKPNLSALVYEGLENLRVISFNGNQLGGGLNLSHFWHNGLSGQLDLQHFLFENNRFDDIKVDPSVFAGSPFFLTNLQAVKINGNFLTFEDINNTAHFFQMKRQAIPLGIGAPPEVAGKVHYVPSNAPTLGTLGNRKDPYSFDYTDQRDRGIGGVRRRRAGDSTMLDIDMGAPIFPKLSPATAVLNWYNNYDWEIVDTIAGTVITALMGNVTIDSLGSGLQVSGLNDPVHYSMGIDTQRIDDMMFKDMDSATHDKKSYRLIVTNRAFPLDTLYSQYKKVRIGGCVDSVGAPVHCQTIIVQFADTTSGATKQRIRAELDMTLLDSCLCGDVELWGMSDTMNVQEIDVEGNGSGTRKASAQVKQNNPIALLSADPNYDVVTDTSNASTVTNLNFPPNTTTTADSATVLVAILDSGVDYDYTPLQNHLVHGPGDNCLTGVEYGYNFVDDNNNADDDFGHGTAVAGIVAGLVPAGGLPDTSQYKEKIAILPLKITNNAKQGTVFEAACGLHYAANYRKQVQTKNGTETARVRVINTSWGYYGEPCVTLENALRYVSEDCGVLVVSSAGNDGKNIMPKTNWHWPSNSIWDDPSTADDDNFEDNVLGVGAVSSAALDTRASYSNYSTKHVDMLAIGNYNSTQAGTTNGYGNVNGTSFSTAAVSRAAALLFAEYPEASLYAVKYALKEGGDSLSATWADTTTAWGVRLNFANALAVLDTLYKKDSCYNFVENGALANSSSPVSVVEIEDEKTGENLAFIYPNPFSDKLNIVLNQSHSQTVLQLISIEGKTIQQQVLNQGTTSIELSLEELPVGLYLLRIQQGNTQVTQKVIKLR